MPFSWWRTLWQTRRVALSHLHVVFYTRKSCHLCQDAWDLLQRERERYEFHLVAVDIDSSRELAEEYGECVPVVTVNGKARFRGKINPRLVSRLFAAEARKSESERRDTNQ